MLLHPLHDYMQSHGTALRFPPPAYTLHEPFGSRYLVPISTNPLLPHIPCPTSSINYPLAYYGAYFGIRADAFSYAIMCQGKDKLNYYMKDYKKRSDTLTKKEQDVMKDMKIVQEMYARGLEFMPIDIYRAKAKMFQIIDGKLMPSLASIEGMGDKAAEAVEEASKDGPYLSLDDFRQRTKVSKTVIDLMAELGLFGNLPQSNQLSLFDFS